jgi:hypothetical protein
MGTEATATAEKTLSSGEALTEILRLTRDNNRMLTELIGFVNEAGEQISSMASSGFGDLLGSLIGGNGGSGNGD